VQVIESTLTENRAKTGGGLFNQQALASVSSTSVTNNQAYIGGGMVNSGLDLRAYTQEGSGPLERKTDGDKRQLSSGVNAVDMANSSVSGNSALIGGGIANLLSGVTRIEGSTLNHNYAVRGGGGLLAFRGMSFITNGTLSGNATAAEGAGSAILATDINLLQLETPQRSELRERNPDGATSTDQTSAERLSRMLEEAASEREPIPAITLTGLIHTTVSNHTGPVPTLAFAGGQAAFNNTLIGDNSGDNCVAAFYTAFQANHTLVDDASCTLYSPGFSETNAIGIGPLQDNGGTTLTHALTAASPALDAGDPATPESVPLTTDQRGEGFARVVNDLPDIGAFEARAPHLEVGGLTAEGLDFGALPVGETSSPLDLTLSNTGELALEPGEISVEGDYAISENGCEGRSLAQNESCTLRITFTPSAEGSRPGTLTVPSNAADSPLEANLSGEGLIRALTLDDVAFGGQELGSVSEQNLRISNTGSTSLTIDGITITNTSNGAFTIFDDPCSGKTLAVDEGCSLGIRFNPSTTGPLSDTLEVASNASDSPHTANLSGNGIEADEPPPVEPTPQQPAEPIPALGPLGLWLASLGAGLLGLLGMRRRKP
jgi:hypothetical protein